MFPKELKPTLPASSPNSLNPEAMEERKLTPEQIDDLFTFCGERGAYYYDVQIELVDHYASAIEKRWDTAPALTFEQALQLEYNHFNQYDFKQIIEEKESSLKKKYIRLQGKYVLEYFRLPKVLMTIALILTLYTAFLLSENFIKIYILVCLPASMIIWLYGLIFQRRRYRIKLITKNELLLYNEYKRIRTSAGAAILLLNLPISTFNVIGKEQILASPHLVYVKFAFAFVSVLLVILTLIVVIYMPKRIHEDFTREFPQFVKS
jgi:hypothetical protein